MRDDGSVCGQMWMHSTRRKYNKAHARDEQQATSNTQPKTRRWKRLLLLRLLLAGRRPTLRWEKPPPPPPPSGRNRSVTGSVANGPPTISVVPPTWSRPYYNDERDAWPAGGRPWFKSLRGSVVVVVIAVTAVITVYCRGGGDVTDGANWYRRDSAHRDTMTTSW